MTGMLVNTYHDLTVFVCSFACGQLTGFVFDIFRAIRKAFVPGKKALALQDALYCAAVFYMFSQTVNITNNGDLRWYIFAALILGTVLYFSLESPAVLPILARICMFFKKVFEKFSAFLQKLGIVLTKPFVKVKKWFLIIKEKTLSLFRQFSLKKSSKEP